MEPYEYYTYEAPPDPEESKGFFDLMFGDVNQALARDQALRHSMWHEAVHGSSSSSSWGHEPEPSVTLPDEMERARQREMRIMERVHQERPVPGKKNFEKGRESLEETRKQERSILPYVPAARNAAMNVVNFLH